MDLLDFITQHATRRKASQKSAREKIDVTIKYNLKMAFILAVNTKKIENR